MFPNWRGMFWNPDPVLVLLRGFVPRAFKPICRLPIATLSRIAPCAMIPDQPLRASSAIISPTSALRGEPAPSITRTLHWPLSDKVWRIRLLSSWTLIVEIWPKKLLIPPKFWNERSQLCSWSSKSSNKSAVEKFMIFLGEKTFDCVHEFVSQGVTVLITDVFHLFK